MDTGLEIAFHGMDKLPAVEAKVRHRIDKLEQHFGRITSFRAVIDAPHQRHRKGTHYAVRLEAHVPSAVFTIDREPGNDNAHEDVNVAIRDAFDAMERKMRGWADTHSGRPRTQATPLQGRIVELNPQEGFGQIALTDGRLVYFHRNSVVDVDFDDLGLEDTVALALDQGDSAKGPHASTVHRISAQRFVDKPL